MIFNGESKAIKIIHGHGTGVLKDAVREWCASQSGRFKAVNFCSNYFDSAFKLSSHFLMTHYKQVDYFFINN